MSSVNFRFVILVAVGLMLSAMFLASPVVAGDPDEIIGPMDIDLFKCVIKKNEDGTDKKPWEEISIDKEREEIRQNSVGKIDDDINALAEACSRKERDRAELIPIEETKIEGYVYEFHPVDPDNPATSEWFAVPSRDVPVVAEGVTFEIFWGSEPDGYFYFYKTRFGKGPVILNLRLPEDVHPINPNIVIESTGLNETWTVFLGFYRGDVPPPQIDQLRTPGGNFLPFSSSKFSSYDSIVGLDGESALPGVGGDQVKPQSATVMAAAGTLLVLLGMTGIVTLGRGYPEMLAYGRRLFSRK
jgi:hypothetical protein